MMEKSKLYLIIALLISVLVFLLITFILIAILIWKRKRDRRYRNNIYQKVSLEFKPHIQQLIQSIDKLNEKIQSASNGISQAQYDNMRDFLKNAERLSAQINDYCNSIRFKKDFYYYIGLHYSSLLLANSLKREQQNIKDAFVYCKKRQEALGRKIDAAKRHCKKSKGEKRDRISREIYEMCKYHKGISIWKSNIGRINSQYHERLDIQNVKTGKIRDFIADNFGKKGEDWKKKCHERALARKRSSIKLSGIYL